MNATIVPEIEMFSRLLSSGHKGVRGGSILLANGTVLRDFDHVSPSLFFVRATTHLKIDHPCHWLSDVVPFLM